VHWHAERAGGMSMGYLLMLLVAVATSPAAAVRGTASGLAPVVDSEWMNYQVTVQLRKEGVGGGSRGSSTCTEAALIRMETELSEWLHDEMVAFKASFAVTQFHSVDAPHRIDFVSDLACRRQDCIRAQGLVQRLQRPAQGLVDVWRHETNHHDDGNDCIGDDAAVAVRIALRNSMAS
jgi:hypothetical protein